MKKHKALYTTKHIDPIYQHDYNSKWNNLAFLDDGNLFNISNVSMSLEQLFILEDTIIHKANIFLNFRI